MGTELLATDIHDRFVTSIHWDRWSPSKWKLYDENHTYLAEIRKVLAPGFLWKVGTREGNEARFEDAQEMVLKTLLVYEYLVAARARITNPNDWTRDAEARTATNARVRADAPNAVCWCALGALAWSLQKDPYDDDKWTLIRALLNFHANELYGQSEVWVNDYLAHDDVLKMYDAAIADYGERIGKR